MDPEQAKGLLNFFLQNIESEFETTRKVIAAVPQGTCDYKPDPKARTGRELAWHLAGANVFFMDGVLNGKFGMEGGEPVPPATIKEILAFWDSTTPERVAKIKNISSEKLTTPVSFFGVMELPAVLYLQMMLMHLSHHRGQLSTYLRPMGSKAPSIYGGSADEPFQAAAQA
jgi:uncharacterized damage-inducible protein DinB